MKKTLNKLIRPLLFAFLLFGSQIPNYAQFNEEAVASNYLSVVRGTFNYVLFSPDTELDSLDDMDHALFKQKEIVEKLIYSVDNLGRSQQETETLWYDGFPMWRSPFHKVIRNRDQVLMYETEQTQVPDTSMRSEKTIEADYFLDSLESANHTRFKEYFLFKHFPKELAQSEYVTIIGPEKYRIEYEDFVQIIDNIQKSVISIYSDHTIKEYYSISIDGKNYLTYKVEIFPIELRNGGMADRVSYTRFSNYKFSEREIVPRTQKFDRDNLVRIYPNPSSHTITIDIPPSMYDKHSRLQIINFQGQVLHQQMVKNVEALSLNVGNILTQDGIYFVRVSHGAKHVNQDFYFTRL
jgi:hypothetical protein